AVRVVPIELVLSVRLSAREKGVRVEADEGSELDAVDALQGSGMARVLRELAARLDDRVRRLRRLVAARVVDLVDGVAARERRESVLRERKAPVAEEALIDDAAMRVVDREAGLPLDSIARDAVVEPVAPHRHARLRVARVAREALLAVVIGATVVVGVVGKRGQGLVAALVHLQVARAARRARRR